ncbi:MAG: Gfo/Idh/MocA family oxidoreductase, partial [Propionibacteriaceae bacterium]|nr:Gfo/Idh/MocA family oxidoreductase [Propionibacteriaceae bacterium]
MNILPTPRVPDPHTGPALRWGILAPGGIATSFVHALRTHTNQRVVAASSRSLERAQQFAAAFGIDRAYGSYEQLVSDAEVDAVYVASPHSEHCYQTLLALQAGKHVLVEKSFARNATEAREMIAAAKAADRTLMEAMWTRFLPRHDIVRQLLEAGTLGELLAVIADHGQNAIHVDRLRDPKLAGGSLLDLGIYPISFANFALGAPEKILATGVVLDSGVEGQISLCCDGYARHPRAQSVLNTSMLVKTPTTAVICGTKARIELDGDFYTPGTVRLVYPDGTALTSPPPQIIGHQGLCHEAVHFARLVAEGRRESPWLPLAES